MYRWTAARAGTYRASDPSTRRRVGSAVTIFAAIGLMQNITFGWIFEHLLGGSGANAIILSGALLGVAALAMLWIKPPSEEDESELMPLGSHRHISVYDRVIVGSDGTPSSLYAVDRAHVVAAEADAHVIVVSAYVPGEERGVGRG
jgi:maltose/moltooligosaccharide transporter